MSRTNQCSSIIGHHTLWVDGAMGLVGVRTMLSRTNKNMSCFLVLELGTVNFLLGLKKTSAIKVGAFPWLYWNSEDVSI